MTEHRDSPESEADPLGEPRPSTRRRFARLVESPAARRVALPKLLIAAGVVGLVVVVAVIAGARFLRGGASWVESRPEQQIKWTDIELLPEPDPWVDGGRLRILEEVRAGTTFGETVPRLGLELKELAKDFARCAWVKQVLKVDRSHYGRLIVSLAYRKPVAFVKLNRPDPNSFIIDEEGVVLPDDDIRWISNRPPFLVQGIPEPLIEIKGHPSTLHPRVGVSWKREADGTLTDDPDPMVIRAAQIARFLRDRKIADKGNPRAPDIVSIWLPDGPDKFFFLMDPARNWVNWGKGPGFEKPGELSFEARWDLLLKWIKLNGPFSTRAPIGIEFTRSEAKLYKGKGAGER